MLVINRCQKDTRAEYEKDSFFGLWPILIDIVFFDNENTCIKSITIY